jgi:hypothetical protein
MLEAASSNANVNGKTPLIVLLVSLCVSLTPTIALKGAVSEMVHALVGVVCHTAMPAVVGFVPPSTERRRQNYQESGKLQVEGVDLLGADVAGEEGNVAGGSSAHYRLHPSGVVYFDQYTNRIAGPQATS